MAMPITHILFMTYIYYDTNNDGYICDYDMDKICEWGKNGIDKGSCG